jgi:hypothetical protein
MFNRKNNIKALETWLVLNEHSKHSISVKGLRAEQKKFMYSSQGRTGRSKTQQQGRVGQKKVPCDGLWLVDHLRHDHIKNVKK